MAAPPPETSRFSRAQIVVWAIALAFLILFIAQNFITVEIRFVVARVETRLVWALLLSALLGFVLGLLLPRLRR